VRGDRTASFRPLRLSVNGCLNQTRGGRWTEPPIEEALAEVQARGHSRVVYYPYGVLADNAESELEGQLAMAGVPGLDAATCRA
jgi:hypothetical protein